MAMADGGDITTDMGGTEKQSNQCCNGICISVVIPGEDLVFPEQIASKEYTFLDAQTHSVDALGLLRPPRLLI